MLSFCNYEEYLGYIMRGISNIIFNAEGIDKEEIIRSLKNMLAEYNEVTGKI